MSVRSQDRTVAGVPGPAVGLSDSAPDPGTAEAARAKVATEPVGVTGLGRRSRCGCARRARPRPGSTGSRPPSSTAAPAPPTRPWARTPAATAGAAAAKPTIITRAQWGADESLRTCEPDYVDKLKGAIVHHTVNSNTYSADRRAGPRCAASTPTTSTATAGATSATSSSSTASAGSSRAASAATTRTSSAPRPRASTCRPSASPPSATTTRAPRAPSRRRPPC